MSSNQFYGQSSGKKAPSISTGEVIKHKSRPSHNVFWQGMKTIWFNSDHKQCIKSINNAMREQL